MMQHDENKTKSRNYLADNSKNVKYLATKAVDS